MLVCPATVLFLRKKSSLIIHTMYMFPLIHFAISKYVEMLTEVVCNNIYTSCLVPFCSSFEVEHKAQR